MRLEFEGFGVGVVPGLGFVEMPHELIDGEGVEVLADEVEHEPIADLLQIAQGLGFKNGLHIRALGGFAALRKKSLEINSANEPFW